MKSFLALLITLFFVFPFVSRSQERSAFNLNNIHHKNIQEVMAIYAPHALKNVAYNPFRFAQNLNQTKNTNEIKQALDSMDVFDNGNIYSKQKYTYNSNGQCILNSYFTLNEASELINYSKTIYTYSDNGKIQELQIQSWREGLSDWVNFIKITYAYEDDLMKETLMFFWEVETNEWQSTTKDLYEYDDDNQLIYIVSKSENAGSWENHKKEAYSYNDDHYPYLWIAYKWLEEDWQPSDKREQFFDDLSNLNLIIDSDWLESTEEWFDISKNEYTYNDDNQRIMALYIFFDTQDSQWHNQYKDEYTKDEYDNRIQEIDYIWENENWLKLSKDEWAFNYSFPANELILPNNYLYAHSHMLTEANYFHWDGTSWYPWNNDVLYYSPKDINGLEVYSAPKANIYPNPNKGIFKVEITDTKSPSTISIINVSGQIILEENFSDLSSKINKSYDLSAYNKGIYLLKVSNNSRSNTFKIAIY